MTRGGGLTRSTPSVAYPSNNWETDANCRAGTGAMDILSGDANTRMTLVSGGHVLLPWSYLCRRPASGSAGLALSDGTLPVKGLFCL